MLSVIKEPMFNFCFIEILHLEGHPNRISGSRVKAILLNGYIWPIGGASAVEGLQPMRPPRLVYLKSHSDLFVRELCLGYAVKLNMFE